MALLAQPGPMAVVEALGEAAILGAVARGSWGSWSRTSPPRSILGGGGEEVALLRPEEGQGEETEARILQDCWRQSWSSWVQALPRKVLSKLNFSIPGDMIRQVVQCRPGTVEQVLLVLQQKIEEKQQQSKAVSSPGQELGVRAALEDISYLETGYSKAKSSMGGGYAQDSPRAAGVKKSCHGCAQAPLGDSAIRLQLAEREQALLLAQETIQILQLKVGRLEQLLHLKNVRIDDLSRRLQEAQCQQR
ncbi:PREDICTED: sperm flagellar protein 1 [Haliaeetus leucocephalus]|uniref:sperm flagellar protein 1 n=1 Tax=Haliaeetus leucocephalus TaxID=52644 RepID=UPI00053CC203|nr:PREDICTED: sperm flagellar protein 1 [Haliaeetus leucocephalus]